MRFLNGLDLNLIPVLEALLSTASVTESARRLHVTQPAMSASLAKLRAHFNDDLLVRHGQKMVLTALGQQLLEPLPDLLRTIENTLDVCGDFDLETARFAITIASSDHHLQTVLPCLLPELSALAPHVRLNFIPIAGGTWENMTRGAVDFLILPASVASPKLNSTALFDDVYVCAVWSENPLTSTGISAQDFSTRGHVVARYYGGPLGSEHRLLERLGVSRRTEVVVHSPSLLGAALVGSDRIATLPLRLAQAQARYLPIRLLAMPYELPPIRVVLAWHPSRENVPAMRWFRERVEQAMRKAVAEPWPEGQGAAAGR